MDPSEEAAIGRVLHVRFVAGDEAAFQEVYERYHARLFKHLAYKANHHESMIWDLEVAADATSIALSDYFFHPESFDPSKSSLLTYLRNAAYRDYQNELGKELRHQRRRDVENENDDWKEVIDADLPVDEQVVLEAGNARGEELMREICKTEEELVILKQIIDKERDANKCIKELGWPPGEESVRRLYREKGKLMKRLERSPPRLTRGERP